MKGIILSIHPEYVKKILSHEKRYEYRTRACSNEIHKIYIYETHPTKMIVAEAEVIRVLKDKPENIWSKTYKFGGITKNDFDEYFKNKNIAYAYELGQIIKYDEPKPLNEFGIKTAPQSFVYI